MMKYLLLCLGLTAVFAASTPAQNKPFTDARGEADVRKFFDAYAEDLRKHDREAIVARYDPRGTYFMGHGRKSFQAFEAVRERYLKHWAGPKDFRWDEVAVEMTSKTSAVVTAKFVWTGDSGKPANCSYTGLFIRYSAGWRIRIEDESCAAEPQDSK